MKAAVSVAAVVLLCCVAACGMPALPLWTDSRWIVDADGKRVKFACVNWSGAAQKDFVIGGLDHQPASSIANMIASWGFNCVRVPFSVELVVSNPVVRSDRLTANPHLVGKTALEVLDAVVDAMDSAGLMVILDNHMSRGDWCCSEKDGNGLWYTTGYSQDVWVKMWVEIASRYAKPGSNVVAAELRNELRCATVDGEYRCPTWATGDPKTDWKLAATTAADAIHASANKDLVIFVDGLSYATDLTGVYAHPVTLAVPNKTAYVAHDYSWSQPQAGADALDKVLGDDWGYIVTQHQTFTAPVWVSEFGTWHDGSQFSGWWPEFLDYLSRADLDWGYWRVDGTESNGTGRTFGAPAGFGIFNATWNGPASNGLLLNALKPHIPPTQGPGVSF